MNTGSRMIHCGNICKASLRVFCRMVLCHRVSLCILVSLSLFSKGSQLSEHNKSINVDSPSVFSFLHPDWELMYGSCDSHRLTLGLKTYPKLAEDYSWMARLPTTTPPNKNSVLHTEIATSPVSWMFTIKPMTETLTSSGISNVLAFSQGTWVHDCSCCPPMVHHSSNHVPRFRNHPSESLKMGDVFPRENLGKTFMLSFGKGH